MASQITLDEYLHQYERELVERPGLRLGQTAFNVLCAVRPRLAERVRSTRTDPFYDDARLPAFFEYIDAEWDEVSES